jgi:putative spermidine/putrescine transport system permease protein
MSRHALKSRGEIIVNWLIGAVLALTLIALYAPVLIVVLGAFFLDGQGNFNFTQPTTAYFTKLAANVQLMDSVWNTLIVGTGAVLFSTVFALVIALYVHTRNHAGSVRGPAALQFLVFLPFLLPPLIVGLSLLIFFRTIGIATGIHAVIIGHTLFVLALVYRTILNRLTQMGHSMIEASFDLGATPMQTFWRVIFPQLRGSVIIGAVLAFALSFDETLISLFLVGDQNTLPIRLWAMMRLGISPDVNAIATIVLVVSIGLVFYATRRMDIIDARSSSEG